MLPNESNVTFFMLPFMADFFMPAFMVFMVFMADFLTGRRKCLACQYDDRAIGITVKRNASLMVIPLKTKYFF